MAYEHKPGTFSLFKNDKEGNDKRPDYKGDGMDLGGNAIKVSAWLKDGAKGKFMSCKIEMKNQDHAPARPTQSGAVAAGEPFGDDVPFAGRTSNYAT